MFPTTIWTTIRAAGERQEDALDTFAERYRAPVAAFLRARGAPAGEVDDLCQDVFVRVLAGGVLEKADRGRGRFRALLSTVTARVLHDRRRKRRELPSEEPDDIEAGGEADDPEFDQVWAWNLVERALASLREQGSTYHAVLVGHLAGQRQDRGRLWIARRKLAEAVRREVAFTCVSHEAAQAELEHLAPYLDSRQKD